MGSGWSQAITWYCVATRAFMMCRNSHSLRCSSRSARLWCVVTKALPWLVLGNCNARVYARCDSSGWIHSVHSTTAKEMVGGPPIVAAVATSPPETRDTSRGTLLICCNEVTSFTVQKPVYLPSRINSAMLQSLACRNWLKSGAPTPTNEIKRDFILPPPLETLDLALLDSYPYPLTKRRLDS